MPDDEYSLYISGENCTLVVGGTTYDLRVDQKNRKLYSDGSSDKVEFSVSGRDIIIEVEGVKMTFSKK